MKIRLKVFALKNFFWKRHDNATTIEYITVVINCQTSVHVQYCSRGKTLDIYKTYINIYIYIYNAYLDQISDPIIRCLK